MKHVYALLTGLVFGIGIAVSGMMDPAKVLNFFDVAAMLQAYLVSDPSVDFNGDLGVDFHDVSLFLMVYSNGCM